jgi:hypothetical protein
MTSLPTLACALVLAGGLTAPAFAASAGTPTPGATGDQSDANGQSAMSNDQNGMNNDQSQIYNGNRNGQAAMHIGKALRAELSKAGYTDINIMPTSFMVRAKDSQGNPVMMMISPDSVSAIMQEDANTASTANHNGNAAGAMPGPASTGGSQPATPGATSP